MLAPKMWAPTRTCEEKPDMISHRWSNKKYDPAAQEWQVCPSGMTQITENFNGNSFSSGTQSALNVDKMLFKLVHAVEQSIILVVVCMCRFS